jgi:hypothetical protein
MVLACALAATTLRLTIGALNSPADADPGSAAHSARQAVAAGASGAASTAAAVPSGASSVAAALDALTATLTAMPGVSSDDVSIAAYDPTSGVSYSYGGATDFDTASIVKVDILATLLLQHQDAGTALTDSETSLATSMIENSDNDSATSLWDDIGDDAGLTAANARLGLTATVAGTDGYWGLTTTTAADQITLLRDLTDSNSVLSSASQAMILGLMSDVESDQSWGVSAAADSGSTPALKNGWLATTADGGLWVVNSIGEVTVDGRPMLLAVLTHHQSSEDTGIDLAQQVASAVAPALAALR